MNEYSNETRLMVERDQYKEQLLNYHQRMCKIFIEHEHEMMQLINVISDQLYATRCRVYDLADLQAWAEARKTTKIR